MERNTAALCCECVCINQRCKSHWSVSLRSPTGFTFHLNTLTQTQNWSRYWLEPNKSHYTGANVTLTEHKILLKTGCGSETLKQRGPLQLKLFLWVHRIIRTKIKVRGADVTVWDQCMSNSKFFKPSAVLCSHKIDINTIFNMMKSSTSP